MVVVLLTGFAGGFVAGISPCVLPVLPVLFVAGGAGGSRRRAYLVVAGLTISFAVMTLLGTLILSALPIPADAVRWAALALLLLLGLSLIVPRLGAAVSRPFARLGAFRVSGDSGGLALGLALGAVYVPCAGPVLATIAVAGASQQIGWSTIALTAAFALGTALPLLGFALAGHGVAARIATFRRHQRAVRVAAGALVIALAVALTFNLTDIIQRRIPDYTAPLDAAVAAVGLQSGDPGAAAAAPITSAGSARPTGSPTADLVVPLRDCARNADGALRDCGPMPGIVGIQQWLNTPNGSPVPLTQLAGKVVIVDFWTYSCINCQRAVPHLQSWYERYHESGLVVIGVHTPEFAFERVPRNVVGGIRDLGITYPVALDNSSATWRAFSNNAWPTEYLVDSTGRVRYAWAGEGAYASTESLVRRLLVDATPGRSLPEPVEGAGAAATTH
jgi:cytochrome c biogenesis protein CcdA/thiol-disulfide isomerase/thioredoxin